MNLLFSELFQFSSGRIICKTELGESPQVELCRLYRFLLCQILLVFPHFTSSPESARDDLLLLTSKAGVLVKHWLCVGPG